MSMPAVVLCTRAWLVLSFLVIIILCISWSRIEYLAVQGNLTVCKIGMV